MNMPKVVPSVTSLIKVAIAIVIIFAVIRFAPLPDTVKNLFRA